MKDASENDDFSVSASAEAVKQWKKQLDDENCMWIDVLVREETNRIFSRSDLDKLIELMEVLPEGLVASSQPGLSQDRVGTILRAFYASLFSTLSSSQFEKIIDPEVREITRRKSAEIVAAGHEKVIPLYCLLKDFIPKTISSPIRFIKLFQTPLIHTIEAFLPILWKRSRCC